MGGSVRDKATDYGGVINIDARELVRVTKALGGLKAQAPGAINRALNRTAQAARTAAARAVKDNYYVKVSDAKKTMKIHRGTKQRLGAFVLSKGNLVPLDKYKVKPKTIRTGKKQPKRKAAVTKGKSPSLMPGSFMANINGPKLMQRVGKRRLPISRLMGPAIPQLVDNDDVINEVDKVVMETYQKRMDHEIRRILDRQGGNR